MTLVHMDVKLGPKGEEMVEMFSACENDSSVSVCFSTELKSKSVEPEFLLTKPGVIVDFP